MFFLTSEASRERESVKILLFVHKNNKYKKN